MLAKLRQIWSKLTGWIPAKWRRGLTIAFYVIAALIIISGLSFVGWCTYWIGHYYNNEATIVQTWLPSESFDMDDNRRAAGVYYAPTDESIQPKKIYSGLPKLYKWDNIPQEAKEGLMSVEQKGFLTDWLAVSPEGMIRAIGKNLSEGRVAAGGSTITQMLARTLWLGYEQTLDRKLKEIAYALRIDQKYKREEQFALFYSSVSFGSVNGYPVVGVPEAAWVFFKVDLTKKGTLTSKQWAMLIGMIKGPTYYSPVRNQKSKARCMARANTVLGVWARNGVISIEEYEAALAADLKLNVQKFPGKYGQQYSAVATAYKVTREELELDPKDKAINGAVIITSFDEAVQQYFTQAFANLPAGMQGAGIVIDSATGRVLAVYGGWDTLNRLFAVRQPGSIDKIFVYLKALELGIITPETIFVDEPAVFAAPGGPYQPHNIGNKYTRKPTTAQEAFEQSKNVIAVRVGEQVGWGELVKFFQLLGLEHLDKDGKGNLFPAPSMTLGAFETTLPQVAAAINAVATGGRLVQPRFVQSVTMPDGTTYGDDVFGTEPPAQVFSGKAAALMSEMMQGVATRGTGAGIYAKEYGFKGPVAIKTGSAPTLALAGGFTFGGLTFVGAVGPDKSTGLTDKQKASILGGKLVVPVLAKFLASMQSDKRFAHYFGTSAPVPAIPTPTTDASASPTPTPELEEVPNVPEPLATPAQGKPTPEQTPPPPPSEPQKVQEWEREERPVVPVKPPLPARTPRPRPTPEVLERPVIPTRPRP